MVIKDFFFARSFERWKEKRTLDVVFRKYKDPIVLAAIELASILRQINLDYPPDFLKRKVLDNEPERLMHNSAGDPYFLRYKLATTVFGLCSFFGWLELYRQDVGYLDSGRSELNSRFEKCLKKIRADFADGDINPATDFLKWNDPLIFREEQRAIGETMILSGAGSSRVVIRYARFIEVFGKKRAESVQHRWINTATSFFLQTGSGEKDFREERIRRVIIHLVDLIEILDNSRLSDTFRQLRTELRSRKPGDRSLISDSV